MITDECKIPRKLLNKTQRIWLAFLITAVALLATAAHSGAGPLVSSPPLIMTPPISLSEQTPDFDLAAKSRIVRLADGTLVVIYLEAITNDPARNVYDLQADVERPANDIFVRTCASATTDCADQDNWTPPVNISNTADQYSIHTDWNGTTDGQDDRLPFYGDSDKPTIFSSGPHVVVTWVDKYCPGDDPAQMTPQRTITYLERDLREVPFSCLYAAHASDTAVTTGIWTVNRLTDGVRDAKQDINRGLQNGGWAIIWQEDPRGLQPGEAEGPGDGASGAHTSFGTDIWYARTTQVLTANGDYGVWQAPIRLTDNQITYGITMGLEELNPIKDADGNLIDLSPEAQQIENGATGASRPMLALVSNTAIIAYEETKGSQGGQRSGANEAMAGKFVRYHQFPFNNPPTDTVGKSGCIISDPNENGRRVRMVAQGTPGSSGLRWAIFWRQGEGGQGATADIVLRYGLTNFTNSNLVPAVDADCMTSNYDEAMLLENDYPLNISSNTPTATDLNLGDFTGANSAENARAHRALLRGDDLYIAYTYTHDDALVQLPIPQANYNYWLRHFNAAELSWTTPNNLSKITNNLVNVKEPRLMGTPGNGPNCPTDPDDCQNRDVFFVAWGTDKKNPYTGQTIDLFIFVTYTQNRGDTFAPAKPMAGGPRQVEDQMRATPGGGLLFSVWNQSDSNGNANVQFNIGTRPTN